MIAFRY
jgi:hypothetical protein